MEVTAAGIALSAGGVPGSSLGLLNLLLSGLVVAVIGCLRCGTNLGCIVLTARDSRRLERVRDVLLS